MNNKVKRPNVILINCDDLGYGDLGCFGSNVNKSKHLDKLADDGMVFTSFYAASPVCSPSRAALMTGCYPPRVGVNKVLDPGVPIGLNSDEFTMPELFKNAGYSTMIVGKWHCGDQKEFLPCNFGFDHYYGLPYSNDMGMQKGFDDKVKHPPLPLMSDDQVIEEQPDQRGLTERYVEKCVSFIRENKDKEFFLYFAQMHVHLPLYAAERFVNESGNGDFGACVASLDWACGCIIHELERLNILDDTIIMFTSDNGSRGDHGASNNPLKGGKFTTWEGGLRVPFIFYWKGKVKPGRNDQMISQIDLLPTLASIIDCPLGENDIDGIDQSKMILYGDDTKRDEFIYYNGGAKLEAVRKNDWKLHVYKEGKNVKLLYNLKSDISEQKNVYDEHPEIVDDLLLTYNRFREMLGDSLTGICGSDVRKCGVVENPVTLTTYDPDHPYIVALYDKDDKG